MKICIFDPYVKKFSGDMIKWWQDHGHEVLFDTYYDPEKVWWADVVWFETCDNNLLAATNPSQALIDDPTSKSPWALRDIDMINKRVIVRPIDIEVWQGHHAHDNMWQDGNDCIFIAPHIRDIMMADSRPQASDMKAHVIPCGVDLSRWTFKERTPNKKVGIVAERWVSKGVDYVIQLAMALPDYEFHWLGRNNDYHWEHEYLKDKIEKVCPNLMLEEDFVEDLDAWWEDKSFVLSGSKKEAFGYSIAEAMAKGIKPIIHNFYGAEAIWPDLCWNSIEEAVAMITEEEYNSNLYRQYLIDHGYTIDAMMSKIMDIING